MGNYKQKYENLIEKLKKAKEKSGGYTFTSVIDTILPELKESEDEKIRKFIIQELSCLRAGEYVGEELSDRYKDLTEAISWVERQKPVEWSEDILIEGIKQVGLTQLQIDWLKSLKPHWKPSEEQMKALTIAVHDSHEHCYYKNLYSLYNDLKSL